MEVSNSGQFIELFDNSRYIRIKDIRIKKKDLISRERLSY